jgi:dienelactone hydrolase
VGAAIGVAAMVWARLAWGGDPPRALPAGALPQDARLGPLKDLDGVFPFVVPESGRAWTARVIRLRREIEVALGLYPLPARTPLNAVIHGRVDREDYTVDRVYFESLPGFYVTGSLYRPKGASGKRPGVLCPHGHWSNGRFHDMGVEGVRKEIAQGAEAFEEGGRSPLQARCVGLARLGCVVFHYDMIGYADSVQIDQGLAHGFAKQRPEMNTVEDWGLFSPQAEAHAQSVMGLQTWNSMRALDFLASLPDVDGNYIGVTGASGGGTQTFILAAIDYRVNVAFPAVMVSTHMQGGCTCENACGLRVAAGNVHFAAMIATRPLGMTCANDWTLDMATNGFPQLQALYGKLHVPEAVMLHRGEQFGHNYNAPSRKAMYGWMNRWLRLGAAEPIGERDYRRLTQEEMTVWNAVHPKPAGGPELERRLLAHWWAATQQGLAEARRTAIGFEETYAGGIESVLGRRLDEVGPTEWAEKGSEERGDCRIRVGLIRNPGRNEEVPAVRVEPRGAQGRVVVWVDPAGKAGLFGAGGALRTEVAQWVGAGATVVGVDLIYQGEFLGDSGPLQKTRKVKNPREAAAYTFGYNHTVFAQRVHDILTVVSHLKAGTPAPKSIALVGLGGAGPWVAAAASQTRAAVDQVVVDTAGFRFGKVLDIHDPAFLPGGAVYGDLPGMLAVCAPTRLWLAGEGKAAPELVREAYARAGAGPRLEVHGGEAPDRGAAAAQWLLGEWKRGDKEK